MKKNVVKLSYTFIDPNEPKVLEQQLCKILVEKLLAFYKENAVIRESPT